MLDALYTAPDLCSRQIAARIEQVGQKTDQVHPRTVLVPFVCNALRTTEGQVTLHATSALVQYILPWLQRPSNAHIVLVAEAEMIQGLARMVHALDGLALADKPWTWPPVASPIKVHGVLYRLSLEFRKGDVCHVHAVDLHGSPVSPPTRDVAALSPPSALPPPLPLASLPYTPTPSSSPGLRPVPSPLLHTSPSASGHIVVPPSQPPSYRSSHAYDMTSMLRMLEKGDASRTEGSRSDHSASTSPTSGSSWTGDRLRSLAAFRSHDTSGRSSPGASRNGSALAVSPGTLSSHASTPTLSNVSAFAQTLFSYLPSSGSTPTVPSDVGTQWQSICHRLLPLFQGEAVTTPLEVITATSEAYIQQLYRQSPEHAAAIVEENLHQLAHTGLGGITAKLQGTDHVALLTTLVDAWNGYYTTTVPYLVAGLYPVQEYGAYSAYRSSISRPSVRVDHVFYVAFRDRVLLPAEAWLPGTWHTLDSIALQSRTAQRIASTEALRTGLVHLAHVLTGLHTDDDAQVRMEQIRKALLHPPTAPPPVLSPLAIA